MSGRSITKKANNNPKGEFNEPEQRLQPNQRLSELVLQLQNDEEFPALGTLPSTTTKSHRSVEVNNFIHCSNHLLFFAVLAEENIVHSQKRSNPKEQ